MEAKGERIMMTLKNTGRASSIPAGLAAGAMSSLAVTAIGASVTAWLVLRGYLRPDWTGYCAMVILLCAAALGGGMAMGRIKRLRAQMVLASAGIYYVCLVVINALFFGGQYRGMGVTAAMVLCGAVLVIVLVPGDENRAGCRRRKKYRR